jgi:hypothetical protein
MFLGKSIEVYKHIAMLTSIEGLVLISAPSEPSSLPAKPARLGSNGLVTKLIASLIFLGLGIEPNQRRGA